MPDRNWWTPQRIEGARFTLSWLADLTKKRHQEIAEKLEQLPNQKIQRQGAPNGRSVGADVRA